MLARAIFTLCVVVLGTQSGLADYLLTPLSDGANQRSVLWGETFTLDLELASDSGDTHDSAILQIIFTRPGLSYEAYTWGAPYTNDPLYDDSTPDFAALPTLIDADTFVDPLNPSLIDVELSNVLIGDDFGVGTLASLTLHVPDDYGFQGALYIAVQPDTFADGFNVVPTTGGQVFELNIIPEPTMLALLLLGVAFRRRAF